MGSRAEPRASSTPPTIHILRRAPLIFSTKGKETVSIVTQLLPKMSPAAVKESASDKLSEAPMETTECADRLTLLRSMPEAALECQVCVVGAGPAGLMLGCNLGRFGVKVEIVDDRADQTPVGRQVVANHAGVGGSDYSFVLTD